MHCDNFYLPDNTSVTIIHVDSDCLLIERISVKVKELLGAQYNDILFWIVIEPSIAFRVIGQGPAHIKTIACVGDLHHMSNAITHARDIIKNFMFDYILLTHDQYIAFFESEERYVYGLNIFRFPTSLGLLLEPGRLKSLSPGHQPNIRHIRLIGSNLRTLTHPFRYLIANAAQHSGCVDLLETTLPFDVWLRAVSDSGTVLTCTLNGSYSLQTLAPLAANSLLITDRISTKNHIGRRLSHMHNCLIYTDIADLRRLIHAVKSEIDISVLSQITDNGTNLFNKIQQQEIRMISQVSRAPTPILQRDLDSVHFTIPDILVSIVETIQELHRLAHTLVVIISDRFALHKELLQILDGLLPRLMVQCLSHERTYEYAQSYGHTIDCSDHFYIHFNPLESSGEANISTPCDLIFVKGRENESSSKCAALGILQVATRFPVWQQSQPYYGFSWLNPIQMHIR